MLKNIIGVEEAAKLLGLSPGTVKNYCADGKIPAKKIGKTWIMDKTNLGEAFKMEKVIFEGKEYTLTQEAYIESGHNRKNYDLILDDERPFYMAGAVDAEGNEYTVVWEVIENWEEIEDEQQMVDDWDNPESVEAI